MHVRLKEFNYCKLPITSYLVAVVPPDNLVLRVIKPKQFSTPGTRYGIENEMVALECVFLINTNYSFLGASPGGVVYDPSDTHKPFGDKVPIFIEFK